jgi:hypothetical protein
MRPDRVFVSGSSAIPHPVTDRLLAGLVPTKPAGEAGNLKDYRLVVVDARLGGDDLAAGGIAQRALEAGVALLVLAPAERQLAALASVIGTGSGSAAQAVFVAPAKNAERRFEVKVLGYPGVVVPDETPKKKNKKSEQPRRPKAKCRCHGSGRCEGMALPRFVSHVESRVERGFEAAPRVDLPDGLKYYFTTWSNDHDFTFATDGEYPFSNGQGMFSYDYTIWALLSQTADSEMTYVVTEGTYTVNPGTLDSNDDEARALLLLKVQSGIRPTPAGMDAVEHIPASGIDTWSDTLSLAISYLDPFGDYKIFTFETSVNHSVTSWSVVNSTSGTMQGSTWFVNTPVDGYTFPEDQNDAFNGSGHVEPFPATCAQTLALKDASAWRTPGKYAGSLLFECDSYAFGWSLYGTACGLAFCYDPDADGSRWRFYPWFDVIVNMT